MNMLLQDLDITFKAAHIDIRFHDVGSWDIYVNFYTWTMCDQSSHIDYGVWTSNPSSNGLSFTLLPGVKTYDEAVNSCKSRGAILASIHSIAESNYLYSLLRTSTAWVGYDTSFVLMIW